MQTIWLFHLKLCHSVVEFNMGHGSSLPIQSQMSSLYMSCPLICIYTRPVTVRKWNQVGQCSYIIKVLDSEILPHPMTPPWQCWVETHRKMHACIHIHIPNKRNDAPHLFRRNILRCSIHCVSQYTKWSVISPAVSNFWTLSHAANCVLVCGATSRVVSSMSFLCTNPRERPVRKKPYE